MRIQAWFYRAIARGPREISRSGRFGRKGQALAETAVVIPVLLLLVVGIIEMASAWRTYQVVTNAAREGARVALLPTADRAQVDDRIRQSLEAGGIAWSPTTDDQPSVTANCITADGTGEHPLSVNGVCGQGATGSEARIVVRAFYTFRLLEPVARLACRGECDSNFGTVTIASTSTMRNE